MHLIVRDDQGCFIMWFEWDLHGDFKFHFSKILKWGGKVSSIESPKLS